jgi:hypothetical protein
MNKSPKYYLQNKVHEFPKNRIKDVKWVRESKLKFNKINKDK